RPGLIESYRRKLIEGMRVRGISGDFAERVYEQIAGFGEYGFPESHAASFALITFVSCFLKRFYPAAFSAALVNSQPMGFYSISSLLRDAQDHGVEVLPVDVNVSEWDCVLETASREQEPQAQARGRSLQSGTYPPAALDAPPADWGKAGPAIRLGMRVVKGLSEETARAIAAARDDGPFKSVPDLVRRLSGKLSRQRWRGDLHKLAAADAFESLGLDRRAALWEVRGFSEPVPELFRA